MAYTTDYVYLYKVSGGNAIFVTSNYDVYKASYYPGEGSGYSDMFLQQDKWLVAYTVGSFGYGAEVAWLDSWGNYCSVNIGTKEFLFNLNSLIKSINS